MRDPSRVRVTGALQQYAPGFVVELARMGYRPNAAACQLQLMAHLSRWMDAGRLGPVALTPEVAGAFLAARRAEGYVMWLSPQALAPLLGFLRRLGVVPPPAPAPVTSAEALLGRYRRCPVTEPGQVEALLASCGQNTAVGRRDFAMLTLMARLALRAGEVAAVSLDDISWRAGEVTVRGKGSPPSGCRCRRTQARRSPSTWPMAGPSRLRAPGGCSCGPGHRTAGWPQPESQRRSAVPGSGPGSAGFTRTGCGIRRLPGCWLPGRR